MITSNSTRLRRLLPAAALAAAAVGAPAGTTIACPAVAGTAPVWDIDLYDQCVANVDGNEDPELILEALEFCCEGSGGVWDEQASKCTAPYPEGQGVTPPPTVDRPTVTVLPPDVGAPTAPVITPVAPVQPRMGVG